MLDVLKQKTARTFTVPAVEEFLQRFHSGTLKAKSRSKSDIRVKVYDSRLNTETNLGFSIKSYLGSLPTLFNASRSTNLNYEIRDTKLSAAQIERINQIDSGSKIKSRLKEIVNLGGRLVYVRSENPIFSNNLTLIDSLLPQIVSELLLLYFTGEASKISDLVNILEALNPLQFDQKEGHLFYHYKVKKFLTDVALGMRPSEIWTGELDSTGGYLVVKEGGEIVCYHIYNRNEFEDYLFYNTKLDTPSSSRHAYGKIYKLAEEPYLNLNLQIRFL